MWNHISLVLLCVLLNSCASTKKEFDSSLQAGRCEDALKHLPENSTSAKILKQTTLGATTALSYSLTGASYTVEVAWDLIGGTIMFVGLCGPTIAIATAAGISHGPNAESGGTALPLHVSPENWTHCLRLQLDERLLRRRTIYAVQISAQSQLPFAKSRVASGVA